MGDIAGMRSFIISLVLASITCSAYAVDRADLDYRIRKLTLKFEAMQAKPDKRIPPQALRDAKGIILLDRTKAGFLFAYQGGSGIVMARGPDNGQWSAPAFLKANEASLGFQIGGEQSFVVILLMNPKAVESLANGNFNFGGEASGTAGNNSGGVEGTLSTTEPMMLVYTDREGLYGGAALKGDAISSDTGANSIYYGQFLGINDILFGRRVLPSPSAIGLEQKLDEVAAAVPR
jgi:lipid-binding SYLF domain-containing protein